MLAYRAIHHLPIALLIVLLMGMLAHHTHASTVYIVMPDGDYATIEDALEMVQAGDTIEVRGGTHPAPLIINKSVRLIGIDAPVIEGGGTGSLVVITASDVHLEGFIIRNSGTSIIKEDTGVVIQADGVSIINNQIENVLFGIYFANAKHSMAQNNRVSCHDLELSRRGDGVRVWYSEHITLTGNHITQCRDALIWYTNYILIENNQFTDNLYGLHFMYSDHATITNNLFSGNSVGVYVMYSEHLTITDNSMLWNRGTSGYGIAFKDSNYITVTNNAVIGNRSGIYIDNSPMLPDITTPFVGNFFAYNDIGISALPSVARNSFSGNAFIENIQQASTLGRGNLLRNNWQVDGIGNYWSDYVGYDGDGDGVGDVPYRVEKLFEDLIDEHPALRLFVYSPASQSVNFAAVAFPSLRPDPKVIDDAPLMAYVVPAHIAQAKQPLAVPFFILSLLLLGMGGGVCWVALRPVPSHIEHTPPDVTYQPAAVQGKN